MKVDGTQLNWTAESFQWQRLLNRHRVAFVELGTCARIQEGFARPATNEDWDCRAVVLLSGENSGKIMPMAFWFRVGDRMAPKVKLCSVWFATRDEMLKFCLYGLSDMCELQIRTLQTRFNRTALSLREIAKLCIPSPRSWHPVELYSPMSDLYDMQKDLLDRSLQEEADLWLQKSLGVDEAKDPLSVEIKWQFENHAYHVSGMRWDHARDFSPRSNLVEAWVESGIYEVRPLRDLVAEATVNTLHRKAREGIKISLPRSMRRYDINTAISLISESTSVSSRRIDLILCENLDRRYAVYYLYSRIARLYLEGLSCAGALQDSDIFSIPVVVPSLEVQKHIASEIDEVVVNRRKRECAAKELKKDIAVQVLKEVSDE